MSHSRTHFRYAGSRAESRRTSSVSWLDMRLRGFACAVLIILCSCTDAVGPRIQGSFALVSVGGQSLPKIHMAMWIDTIYSDTIDVSWDADSVGRIDHRFTGRLTFNGVTSRETGRFTETIQMDRDVIRFLPPICSDSSAGCGTPHTGKLSGDTFKVTFTDPRFEPLVYVRF
jgi:hypothetical protein